MTRLQRLTCTAGRVAWMASCWLLAGCAGNTAQDFEIVGVSKYEAASAFSPQGHSVAGLPNGVYRITAVGSTTTPPERVEKIALARAAEYGVELKKKAFAQQRVAQSVRCGETSILQKGEKVPVRPADYRVVALDVTYGDQVNEPALRATKATAETLKAELAAESVPADQQKALASEIAQACNRKG